MDPSPSQLCEWYKQKAAEAHSSPVALVPTTTCTPGAEHWEQPLCPLAGIPSLSDQEETADVKGIRPDLLMSPMCVLWLLTACLGAYLFL